MAFSKTPSLFPLETYPTVSDEAFTIFHTIDRDLFTRLIQNMGRDPAESMQVMAFWMWLEKQSNESKLVKRMLTFPLPVVNELAEEAVACLKCAENDGFPFDDPSPNEIRLLPDLLFNPAVCLRFFHENRISVLAGVSKIIDTVCSRAFKDILRRDRVGYPEVPANFSGGGMPPPPVQVIGGSWNEVGESSRAAQKRNVGGGGGIVMAPPPPPVVQVMGSMNDVVAETNAAPPPPVVRPVLYYPYPDVPFIPLPRVGGSGFVGPMPVQQEGRRPQVVADAIGIPVQMVAARVVPVYDIGEQRMMMQGGDHIGEMMSSLMISGDTGGRNWEESGNVGVHGGGGGEVDADDRTIFLTFSKGYPISEDEVREFFTRKFGDFIEELIMQEVAEDEQVLYARMVARSPAVIDGIVGRNKAKYSINGKHVWARKYVKKQNSRSPPRGDERHGGGGGAGSSTSAAQGGPQP